MSLSFNKKSNDYKPNLINILIDFTNHYNKYILTSNRSLGHSFCIYYFMTFKFASLKSFLYNYVDLATLQSYLSTKNPF